MTCPHFKVGPVWNFGAAPLHLSQLNFIAASLETMIPETCFHLHLHVYTTQWMVGKWFCISKSSAFRLRSCEEKMFIAFWRFLGETTSIPTRWWNALLAQPRAGVALVDAGFSLAADRADRLTSTETGLHTWLVLWDGPASHAVTCLRWRRCASDARFDTWETECPACRLAGWICVQDALARHISCIFCFVSSILIPFDLFSPSCFPRIFHQRGLSMRRFHSLKKRPDIFALYKCYRWWFYLRASLVLLGICILICFFPSIFLSFIGSPLFNLHLFGV